MPAPLIPIIARVLTAILPRAGAALAGRAAVAGAGEAAAGTAARATAGRTLASHGTSKAVLGTGEAELAAARKARIGRTFRMPTKADTSGITKHVSDSNNQSFIDKIQNARDLLKQVAPQVLAQKDTAAFTPPAATPTPAPPTTPAPQPTVLPRPPIQAPTPPGQPIEQRAGAPPVQPQRPIIIQRQPQTLPTAQAPSAPVQAPPVQPSAPKPQPAPQPTASKILHSPRAKAPGFMDQLRKFATKAGNFAQDAGLYDPSRAARGPGESILRGAHTYLTTTPEQRAAEKISPVKDFAMGWLRSWRRPPVPRKGKKEDEGKSPFKKVKPPPIAGTIPPKPRSREEYEPEKSPRTIEELHKEMLALYQRGVTKGKEADAILDELKRAEALQAKADGKGPLSQPSKGAITLGGRTAPQAPPTPKPPPVPAVQPAPGGNLSSGNLASALAANTSAVHGLTSAMQSQPKQRFATGGMVPGAGRGDKVSALLEPGEWVLTRDQVKRIGEMNLRNQRFQHGGPVQKFAGGGPVSGAADIDVPGRHLSDAFSGALDRGKQALSGPGGFISAVMSTPPALKRFSQDVLQSSESLRRFDGRMSIAFSKLEYGRLRREVETAGATSGSAAVLASAVDSMENDLQGIMLIARIATNYLAVIAAQSVGLLAKIASKTIGPAMLTVLAEIEKNTRDSNAKAGIPVVEFLKKAAEYNKKNRP